MLRSRVCLDKQESSLKPARCMFCLLSQGNTKHNQSIDQTYTTATTAEMLRMQCNGSVTGRQHRWGVGCAHVQQIIFRAVVGRPLTCAGGCLQQERKRIELGLHTRQPRDTSAGKLGGPFWGQWTRMHTFVIGRNCASGIR